MIYVRAGDVGFTRGMGIFQKAIRYVSTGPGEEKTFANHSLMFTTDGEIGPVTTARQALAVEALWHVEENPWYDRHQKSDGYTLRVFRPTFLSDLRKKRLIETARAHIGEKYGWWKLGAHFIDRFLFNDKKILSNVLYIDSRPICSYLVSRAYEVAGYPSAFGPIAAQAQDPDEMMDFCQEESYKGATWNYIGEYKVRV